MYYSLIISDYSDTVCLNICNIMGNVLSKDAEYSEFHMDLSLNEKRLVRAAVKTYTTGTYLSLKLFKRDSEQVDWDFNQKITLSAREFQLLCQNIEKVEQMLDQPVGLIDSLRKPDSTGDSKRPAKTGRQNNCRGQRGFGIISITPLEMASSLLQTDLFI